jgi:predicted dehydrogenase
MYKEDPLAELAGVCDINHERADAAAARLGVPAFYDAPEMLAALRPDLCSVTTGGYEYGSDHYEPTMQALEAGCHVLGEKPISNEIEKGEAMVARRGEGRVLRHQPESPLHPAAYLAKKWQDEGRIGHLLFVNMSMWIKNPAESSPYYRSRRSTRTRWMSCAISAATSRPCSASPRKRRAGRSGPRRTSACVSRTARSAT